MGRRWPGRGGAWPSAQLIFRTYQNTSRAAAPSLRDRASSTLDPTCPALLLLRYEDDAGPSGQPRSVSHRKPTLYATPISERRWQKLTLTGCEPSTTVLGVSTDDNPASSPVAVHENPWVAVPVIAGSGRLGRRTGPRKLRIPMRLRAPIKAGEDGRPILEPGR